MKNLETDPERFFQDFAQILGEYTLTASDVNELMGHYGWRAESRPAASVLPNHKAISALATYGVDLQVERYKGSTLIYSDRNTNRSDNRYDETIARIDKERELWRIKAQNTSKAKIDANRAARQSRLAAQLSLNPKALDII